jgi:hypothetical protein
MQVALLQNLVALGFALFIASMVSFLLVFLIHLLIPKSLLTTYFTQPFFKAGEVAALSGFPLAYIRTIMFMRLLAFPCSGKVRGLTNAYELAPAWLCKFSKITLIYFVFVNLSFVALMMFFFFAL